jgi:hypothetical protein
MTQASHFAKGVQAMITGLAGASIWSEALNNLPLFYRDVLGLEGSAWTAGSGRRSATNMDPERS